MHDRIRIVLLGAALVSFALVSGCATAGVFETAQTAPSGRVQAGAAVTPVIIGVSEGSAGAVFYPLPTLYGKVGLSDNSDLGAAWSFGPGIGLNYKYRFARGRTEGALRLDGSFYGVFFGGVGAAAYSFGPRLLFSDERPGSFPWMVNFGAEYLGASGSGAGSSTDAGVLIALAGAGLPFRVGESRGVRLMPELQLSFPLGAMMSSSGEVSPTLLGEGFVAMLGLSATFAGAQK